MNMAGYAPARGAINVPCEREDGTTTLKPLRKQVHAQTGWIAGTLPELGERFDCDEIEHKPAAGGYAQPALAVTTNES